MGEPRRVGGRPRRLADLVQREMTPACRRRGLADALLVTTWDDIVPADLADVCWPERIEWPRQRRVSDAAGRRAASAKPLTESEGATLVVGALPGAALSLSHATAELAERINRVLGWRAVVRIRVNARHSAPRKRRATARPLPDAAATAAAAVSAQGIANEKLKGAIARLGANVYARASRRRSTAP